MPSVAGRLDHPPDGLRARPVTGGHGKTRGGGPNGRCRP